MTLPSHSSTSIYRGAAYHSHLQGKQTMFVSIPLRRLDHLRRIVPADADARQAATGLLTLGSGDVLDECTISVIPRRLQVNP